MQGKSSICEQMKNILPGENSFLEFAMGGLNLMKYARTNDAWILRSKGIVSGLVLFNQADK